MVNFVDAHLVLGFSSKMYFGHTDTVRWAERLAAMTRLQVAVSSGVEIFVLPSAPSIEAVSRVLVGTGIAWGAQHCHPDDFGAHTGDVSANVLAELGCSYVEVGHAERRRDHGESDELVAATVEAVLRNSMTPVVCIGEEIKEPTGQAADEVIAQLEKALSGASAGRIIAAYEPMWAIGAQKPCPDPHVLAVTAALRSYLGNLPNREGSAVIYGGSAQPGQLEGLGLGIDGLFLGRFAHNPSAIDQLVAEWSRRGRTKR